MTLVEAVLATLAYHDIFDYPLTARETHRYLVERRATQSQVDKILIQLRKEKKVAVNNGYFYLKGRSKIVALRKQRNRLSQTKLKRASFFTQILKIVPTLKLVAISGALAMENSHKDDDIDLAQVTSAGSLWTTRFLANMLLMPFKRDPQGKKIADRACLNIFIEESDLKIRPENLYLAHEITQMKPLWDREGTYARFIKANSWIKKYMPNWQADATRPTANDKSQKKPKALVFSQLALVVESLLKNFQLAYMRSKTTTEKIGKTQLFFHPVDTQKWVIGEYQKRLMRLLSY